MTEKSDRKPTKRAEPEPNPDNVLRKMLGTPPQPRKPKIKESKPEK